MCISALALSSAGPPKQHENIAMWSKYDEASTKLGFQLSELSISIANIDRDRDGLLQNMIKTTIFITLLILCASGSCLDLIAEQQSLCEAQANQSQPINFTMNNPAHHLESFTCPIEEDFFRPATLLQPQESTASYSSLEVRLIRAVASIVVGLSLLAAS